MVSCPNCGGAGGWEDYDIVPYPGPMHEMTEVSYRYWEPCARCHGTGEINTFKEAVAKAARQCGKTLPNV